MTVLSLRRPGGDDASLLRRARRGDRRAHRLYARQHAARAVELVELLIDAPAESATLAATVLDATIAGGVAGDDALVRCAVRTLAAATNDSGLSRLVLAMTDVEGRTDDAVAELIGRPVEEVANLRAASRRQPDGSRGRANECRGWALAARRDRLTVSEQEAAHGHLSVCRSCRARLEDQRRARDKLRVSGTAVSAVVIADVVALSVPAGGAVAGASGVASLVLGKVGVGVVGAAAVAIAATSVGVAAARQAPSHDRTPMHLSRNLKTSVPAHGNVAVPHEVRATAPSSQGRGLPQPSASNTTREAPLPGLTPLPVASILPTPPSLPTGLPVPVPLPTHATSLPPVPQVTAPPVLPATVPTDVVATATSLLGH